MAAYESSNFTKGLCPEPEETLNQFETRYAPIPAEYRWLLLNFGGCYLVEPWISTLKELEETYLSFQEYYEEYMSECDHGPAFPIGGMGDGSIVFLDLENGKIFGLQLRLCRSGGDCRGPLQPSYEPCGAGIGTGGTAQRIVR